MKNVPFSNTFFTGNQNHSSFIIINRWTINYLLFSNVILIPGITDIKSTRKHFSWSTHTLYYYSIYDKCMDKGLEVCKKILYIHEPKKSHKSSLIFKKHIFLWKLREKGNLPQKACLKGWSKTKVKFWTPHLIRYWWHKLWIFMFVSIQCSLFYFSNR